MEQEQQRAIHLDMINSLVGYLEMWQASKPYPLELDKVLEWANDYLEESKTASTLTTHPTP